MQKRTHQELIAHQQGLLHKPLPFTAVLNNIRSLYNVGSIFRTADGAGLEKLWLCGITGIPPSSKISKTALGAESSVAWQYAPSALECIKQLKQSGYQTVILEQAKESIPYQDFKPEAPVCLIVGNEIEGVDEGLLPYCDAAIEIDMAGLKNSLNVTVAFGIAAYHIRRQLLKKEGIDSILPAGAVRS
jgi:23S rRNA (guanosine2251-2'-O)-methyltransferase